MNMSWSYSTTEMGCEGLILPTASPLVQLKRYLRWLLKQTIWSYVTTAMRYLGLRLHTCKC